MKAQVHEVKDLLAGVEFSLSRFFNVYLCLRESEGRAERERQRIQGTLCADITEPDACLELMSCEVVT